MSALDASAPAQQLQQPAGAEASDTSHDVQQMHFQEEEQEQQQLVGTSGLSSSRALLQSSSSTAPTLCGKLGTYTPNIDSAPDRSMFGFAVSSSLDGSTVAVGAPLNITNVKSPGAAFVLKSRSSQTCEYLQNPIAQPAGSFRYYGAQLALSDDASTLVVLDGVEGVKTANAEGNRPVVHVYRRLNNGTYRCGCRAYRCTECAARPIKAVMYGLDGCQQLQMLACGIKGSAIPVLSLPSSKFLLLDSGVRLLAVGNCLSTQCARRYFQKLTGTLRRAMAVTMAVSTTANGNLVLVSFSVAEGYTDKRGSAQLFALNGTGTAMKYTYLQDLALLNMPAGVEMDRAAVVAVAKVPRKCQPPEQQAALQCSRRRSSSSSSERRQLQAL
jgi:hypothetical protein